LSDDSDIEEARALQAASLPPEHKAMGGRNGGVNKFIQQRLKGKELYIKDLQNPGKCLWKV